MLQAKHASVSIQKAENGYMITLQPSYDPLSLIEGFRPVAQEFPDQDKLDKLRRDQERFSPKVYVFSDLKEAWNAVQEFLMDEKLPVPQV